VFSDAGEVWSAQERWAGEPKWGTIEQGLRVEAIARGDRVKARGMSHCC
jgi:hypothetical protein